MVGEDRIRWEEPAVPGVENEDQAKKHGQETFVNVVWLPAKHATEEFPMAGLVGGLESAE